MQPDKHQPPRAIIRTWTERELNLGRGNDEPGGVRSGSGNPELYHFCGRVWGYCIPV